MPKNKMGTQPIAKVLLNMGIPIIFSMVLQACYNIVDSMFVARMPDMNGIVHTGEKAVNALTLAFPIQMLIVAFSIGTGVGVNALVSRLLGEGRKKEVAQSAGNGIVLGILIYLVFALFSLIGITPYLKTQTTDTVILSMGQSYLFICTFLSFGNILYCIYEKILQSTGKTVLSTLAQISGALVNIILDPILIYGLFHFPQLGIKGAALATVIGQIVSLVVAMFFHYRFNKEIPSSLQYLKINGDIVKRIYSVGIPAIIMQALMSFMTYGINIIFVQVSASAVTAYGIFYKIQQFILFAAFGIRDSLTPLVSYNHGYASSKRLKQAIFYGLLYTMIIMILGLIALEVLNKPLTLIFGLTNQTQQLCRLAMKIVGLSFPFVGISIALQGVFQGLDSGLHSLIVSLLRLLIIPLPLAYIFSQMNNAPVLIWWSFVIAEVISAIVALIFMRKDIKEKIDVL